MKDSDEKVQTSTCQRDTEHHCLTCSDEMVPVRVVHVDHEAGLALVEQEKRVGTGLAPVRPDPANTETIGSQRTRAVGIGGREGLGGGLAPILSPSEGLGRGLAPIQEIDITLIENITVGDLLLVHGGVAIARLQEGSTHAS